MESAAAKVALILLAIFVLIGLIWGFAKTQITTFARTLLEHRRQQQHQQEAPPLNLPA